MTKQFQYFLWTVGVVVCAGALYGACSDQSKAGTSSSARASEAPPPKELNLTYQFSEGWFMSHDFFATNTSGEALTEVRLRFTFIGENASPSIDRYWATWPLGAKHQITFPVDQVNNVQRITVSGRADQGIVTADLTRER